MSPPALLSVVGLIAYLVGSLPFGYLAGRAAGIDIRKAGSGNIGATNVGRVLGAKWGIGVLLLDCLKGLAPALLLPRLLPDDGAWRNHAAVLAGVATIVGHMFPCWLGFRGGKGVATSLGVVAVLAPQGSLVAAVAFALVFALFRIVSLGSIVASVAFAVVQMFFLQPAPFSEEHWSLATFSLAIPLLIIVRHASNISRLLRGEEKRFSFRKKAEGDRTAEPSQSRGPESPGPQR